MSNHSRGLVTGTYELEIKSFKFKVRFKQSKVKQNKIYTHTHKKIYTKQDLHKTRFAQNKIYTKQDLHRTRFTQSKVYTKQDLLKTRFTQNKIYTKQDLYKTRFTQSKIYTKQDLLKTRFTQNNIYTKKDQIDKKKINFKSILGVLNFTCFGITNYKSPNIQKPSLKAITSQAIYFFILL